MIKPVNFRALIWGGILFLLFLVLSALESQGFFRNFDPLATMFIQTESTRVFDVPLSVFSLLGSFEFVVVVGLVVAIYLFRKTKKIPYSLAFFGVILVFEFIGKFLLHHASPPQDFFRYTLPFSLPTSYVQTGNSFPSGHVSRTIFMTIILWALNKRLVLRVGLILFALVMVYSRIYLGEHWLSDTLGGILLGGSMGLFAVTYFKNE